MKSLLLFIAMSMVLGGCSTFNIFKKKSSRSPAEFVEIESPKFRDIIDGDIMLVSGKCDGYFDLSVDLEIIPVACKNGHFEMLVDLTRIYSGVISLDAISEGKELLPTETVVVNASKRSKREYCQ